MRLNQTRPSTLQFLPGPGVCLISQCAIKKLHGQDSGQKHIPHIGLGVKKNYL